MQTTLPATQPATSWTGLPYWIQLGLGFLLIGVGASIMASQLRAALPPPEQPGQKRALHHLYAPIFGMTFATLAPFSLPGFEVDSRWLFGLVAPFLWAPLYDYFKKRYESQLGITLPEAKDLTAPKGDKP